MIRWALKVYRKEVRACRLGVLHKYRNLSIGYYQLSTPALPTSTDYGNDSPPYLYTFYPQTVRVVFCKKAALSIFRLSFQRIVPIVLLSVRENLRFLEWERCSRYKPIRSKGNPLWRKVVRFIINSLDYLTRLSLARVQLAVRIYRVFISRPCRVRQTRTNQAVLERFRRLKRITRFRRAPSLLRRSFDRSPLHVSLKRLKCFPPKQEPSNHRTIEPLGISLSATSARLVSSFRNLEKFSNGKEFRNSRAIRQHVQIYK